jgi:Zn-dependent peptidase ImmA (M78 family)
VRPPVVAHKIARDLGFEVRESNRLGRLSARLIDKVIEVNSGDPAVRQRFSVAHELGHHFLGTRHGDGKTAEQEADAFAGELLVPGPMLREVMATTTDTAELRRKFAVSGQVLRIAAEHHKLDDRLTEK